MRVSLIVPIGALGISTFVGIAGAKPSARANRLPAASGCGTTTANSAGFLEAFRSVVSGPVVGYRTHSGLPNLPADSCPVLMLRVGPTHWVADPKVVDQYGQREWIILDSTLTILKVWHTTGDG